MITLKETVELTCNNSINSFSDILGKKIRENYRAEDGAVSRPELFYLMTVMPDIIVERKNFYRQIFHLESQIVFSSLTGHQTCSKTELRGILSLRQLPNVRANAATRLVVRGKRLENRQEIHLKIGVGNLPVKAGKERFGCGPWDKSGKYGPLGEMQRNWRGIKLAKIVLLSKSLTEPKGDIALQSNFLADSAGDIDIIQRCEKPAGQNEGIVEHSRIFSEFVREFIQQRRKLEESKMKLILQRGRLAESKIKLILQRERLEGLIREVIRQSEKLTGSKQDIVKQRGKQSEPKGGIIQPSRIFLEFERDFIQQREKQSEWKKELILQREKQSEWKKELILQRGKLAEPIKELIQRSETLVDSKREIIKPSKMFSEFKIGLIQQSEKQSELKGNIIQPSRILPELKRELIQRVEKQLEQRGDFIQQSRTLPESTREIILQTGNLAEIKRELLPQRENFAKSKTAAVLTNIKQINFDSKITLPRNNYLNLWDNTTLKTQSTTNLQDNAVWQRKEMANLHGSSIRHTESFTEPMEDTTRKEEPLIHLPDQPKPQADAIQPKQGQTDDQKLFQYLCQVNEHNLNMQRRLEQIKPEAQNEIPLAIDKKEARKKSLLALKDPEKVLMEIDRSGGNPMSKTDSKIQSILNLADQDTRLLLEDVMAYPQTGQGRAFQITETDMGGLNHFLREMAEEPPGFQEISRETEKIQRDAEEIRKETVKITREEMEKNSRVLMQNVEELLQSKMESVSDRVYRELERRLKNDQRRRGY